MTYPEERWWKEARYRCALEQYPETENICPEAMAERVESLEQPDTPTPT